MHIVDLFNYRGRNALKMLRVHMLKVSQNQCTYKTMYIDNPTCQLGKTESTACRQKIRSTKFLVETCGLEPQTSRV